MKNRKTVKKYNGNITAAFGADIWLYGVTGVPNLLLKFYKNMGISDLEMMLLIQMFRLRIDEKVLYPSPDNLAEYMSLSREEIVSGILSLKSKDMITETPHYDEQRNEVLTGYDFEPLFEKMSDFWACARMKEVEKTRYILEGQSQSRQSDLSVLYRNFEKEMGRTLSPIEVEKIEQWHREANSDLVLEALSRAVLLGKRNFRYIDTILLEWTKNNLRTVEQINEHDINFKASRVAKERRKPPGSTPQAEPSEDKKALIRSLYRN